MHKRRYTKVMAALRSYGDPCGIARALDLIGERWALLIVRELVLGPKRFSDLRDGLAGASPNVLSQRLRELVASGVVRRRAEGAASYELTEWGHELHPILLRLGVWGARSPAVRGAALGVDALMLALESTFDPNAAVDLHATYELRLGEHRFAVTVDGGRISVVRARPPAPDAIITTDGATLRAVAFGDRPLASAPVAIAGDKQLGRTFFRLFARP
jgi:DNA-binding HxlR family transcriptional regulator